LGMCVFVIQVGIASVTCCLLFLLLFLRDFTSGIGLTRSVEDLTEFHGICIE
jgi:hypothetical protein